MMPPLGRVGVYAKPLGTEAREPVRQLLAFLEGRGIAVLASQETARLAGRVDLAVEGAEIPGQVDLVVVLGGDGTLLGVSRLLGGVDVPLLGINFGSLGFLTEIPREHMLPLLGEILDGNYRVEPRMRIDVELIRGGKPFRSFLALNDAVINKGALARIVDMETYVGGEFLTLYKADGLILSTPTGCTAYSLSAGGPIVEPSGQALILTPICPHTLTHRPLVLDATRDVRVVLAAGEDVMLTVDGQTGLPLERGDEILVRCSDRFLRLVTPGPQSFFRILRQKLKWGER